MDSNRILKKMYAVHAVARLTPALAKSFSGVVSSLFTLLFSIMLVVAALPSPGSTFTVIATTDQATIRDGYNGTTVSGTGLNVTITGSSPSNNYPVSCVAFFGRSDIGQITSTTLRNSNYQDQLSVTFSNLTNFALPHKEIQNSTVIVVNASAPAQTFTNGTDFNISITPGNIQWLQNYTTNSTNTTAITSTNQGTINHTFEAKNATFTNQNHRFTFRIFNQTDSENGFVSVRVNDNFLVNVSIPADNTLNQWNLTNVSGNWSTANQRWVVAFVGHGATGKLNFTINSSSLVFNNGERTLVTYHHGNNATFVNSSALVFNATNYGEQHNATVRCDDNFANYSWTNATGTSAFKFGIDITNPIALAPTFRVHNDTTETTIGNYFNATFSLLDNNPATCGITYVNGNDEVPRNITGALRNPGASSTCDVRVHAENFTIDGNFTILNTWANDAFNRSITNQTSATRQMVVQKLIAGQWNMVSLTGNNLTMATLGGTMPNITAITIFNSRIGFKNHTQWDFGSAANANLQVNTTNGTFVFLDGSTDAVFIQNFTSHALNVPHSNFLAHSTNSSLKGLNTLPIWANVTLNNTLYGCTNVGQVSFGNTNGRTCNNTYQNISRVIWWDAANTRYCGASQGSQISSCRDYRVTNLTLQKGDSVWFQVNGNVTLNFTEIFGGRIA